MPAFNRVIAQRNNNTTAIVPNFLQILPNSGPPIDISNAAVYNLTINNTQFSNGIYTVDMSGLDNSGNLLNLDGGFSAGDGIVDYINIVIFSLTINTSAATFPGLEFTIFFKNIPTGRLTAGPPMLTIGLIDITSETMTPTILCPPFPLLTGENINPSITLKSDGTNFNVVSSGPAGWMGSAALSAILAIFNGASEGCSIM